jgi:two-component SAPR family response regulator
MVKLMINIMVISSENGALSSLTSCMKQLNDYVIRLVETGKDALELVSHEKIDLAVIDENIIDMTGLELVKKLITVNPTVNCALVSSLSPEDYHEETEGLGLLMQLSVNSNEQQQEALFDRFNSVTGLSESQLERVEH